MPWPQLIKANSPDIKSPDTLKSISSIHGPSEQGSFLKDRILGDGNVGILLLDHWIPQGFHHLQLRGKGYQRPALYLSLKMKEVHRLWMDGCEKMQNNTDLQLGLGEQGVAATIPHNLDARSHTPFNPWDTCGLDTLNNKSIRETCQTFERSSP